jgi:EAL domain-containing protein (putative c-di-GMP-specific phosphodiesterase class I)
MTATLGIALFPSDADQADRLLQSAEQTMALAKQNGHNHFQFYVASIDQEIRERKQLEKDLSNALANHELHLVYQPQINLETKRIIGAEALLRWEHPERGMIPPDHFIPVAESNGAIVEIGQWVLNQACWQAARWASEGSPLRIAVNLSAVQLRQESIVDDILNTLKRHNIPAGRLELEVTETSFMTNLSDAVAKLHRLHRAGISIAVDDFGTGYSSLTYLKQMPVQHLKIDKQFIRDLLVNEEDTRIANTIIDLGKSLNLTVVAEGVETAEQEYYLSQRGCKLAQGYFFSKPLPPKEFETFVQTFHARIVENNA